MDDDGFRAFVTAQWEPLTRTAYLLTGDRGAAEDLVQSVLEKSHRRWGRIVRSDAPEIYVRRAMVNTAISWRRRRRVVEVPLLAADAAPAADQYDRADTRQQLLVALRKLPPRTRAILVLRYFEDLSEADIAQVLGCSTGSVKSQASRGLARLRDHVDPYPGNAPARLQGETA
ncbi:SigE family RNA polymerase sigma factor [Dactylosporangium siamense]|uniref:DNA-directed RNA polymerase sigma-70 factor n=1 Tax=Dactylosporangium siamense TaxID=685454 RepID=A0A919PTN5_9ACTN|nr:SigE family RNA polymerase sigma factor [Dactylosporangium siamense]GIG50356.1 DNA-directed RNA polymerase sigma-70 factor [Dactylosporangium siamense]